VCFFSAEFLFLTHSIDYLLYSILTNILGKSHGGPNDEQRMVGDLGNITVDETGTASIHIVIDKVSLYGPHSIIGRSIVIYAGADDMGRGGQEHSLSTGNTGPRIAAGIIGLAL
jgi:superoxide dismutase, Cu-Zn family